MKQTFEITLAMMFLAVAVPIGILMSTQVRGDTSGGVGQGAPGQGAEVHAGDYRLSGPFTHKNLTIFLVNVEPNRLPSSEARRM